MPASGRLHKGFLHGDPICQTIHFGWSSKLRLETNGLFNPVLAPGIKLFERTQKRGLVYCCYKCRKEIVCVVLAGRFLYSSQPRSGLQHVGIY